MRTTKAVLQAENELLRKDSLALIDKMSVMEENIRNLEKRLATYWWMIEE